MKPIVLLVSSESEFNLHIIQNALRHHGADTVHLDCTYDNSNFDLTLHTDDGGCSSYIDLPDRRIHVGDVTGVWTRGISYAGTELPRPISNESLYVAEMSHACSFLWHRLSGARWLNALPSLRATNRMTQLDAAIAEGIAVPPSIVSSNGLRVNEFLDENGQCIIKCVSQGGLSESGPAQLLANSFPLGQRLPRQLPSPVLVQKAVPKQYELRVVVIGDHVFSGGIDSTADERTAVDSRLWTKTGLIFFRVDLDPDEVLALTRLNRRLGYSYSSMDLIRTPDGGLVFLEANPCGQWTFLEAHTGYPITDTMVDYLCGR